MNRTMPSHSLVGPSGSRAISGCAVDPPLSALAVALTISRDSLHVHVPRAFLPTASLRSLHSRDERIFPEATRYSASDHMFIVLSQLANRLAALRPLA